MASGRLVDYLGSGTRAQRPENPNLLAGALGIYRSTDMPNELSLWNGAAWVEFKAGTDPTPPYVPRSTFSILLPELKLFGTELARTLIPYEGVITTGSVTGSCAVAPATTVTLSVGRVGVAAGTITVSTAGVVTFNPPATPVTFASGSTLLITGAEEPALRNLSLLFRL